MSIGWAFPAALLLLLTLPLYLVLARAARPLPMPRAAATAAGGSAASATARLRAAIPSALRVLCHAALVLAIAGPTTAGAIIEETSEGVPIVLAIDVSSSMLAQDFQPRDRLAVAKATIARFVESREADPIGVVAFAAEALTLVPATTHHGLVIGALESLQVGLLEDGTAIGDGLATAVNRLRNLEGEGGVVVLLSDGESNRGTIDPLVAADAAAALGVQVFTVGIGSEGVARVPVAQAPAGFRYAELAVGLDEELLREIADRTGGAYFRATDPAALERIYDEIDQRVPSIVETTRHVQARQWSGLLLLIAAGLLAGEWGMRGSRWGALP